MTKDNQKNIQDFVTDLEQTVKPLEMRLCSLYWQLATTGETKVAQELAETEKKLKMIFSDSQAFSDVKKWKQEGVTDPLLARQVSLLIEAYTPNQLDAETISDLVERQTEIENTFNTFRAEIDGKKVTNNDIKDILKKEMDEGARKKTWEASKQIAQEVSEKVRELARRRNKAAQKLGFANHFEMALEMQELNSKWLFSLFGKLKQETDATFSKKIGELHKKLGKHYGIDSSDVRPWHYEDPFAQSSPSQGGLSLDPFFKNQDLVKMTRDFYQSINLNIADVLERSDLFEKEKKSQHAFCITMNRGKDVRVLANIRPNTYWAATMLHELGHAAYSKNISETLPYFLHSEAHTFTTEAMAMLMERMIHNADGLEKMVGVSKSETANIKKELADQMALDKLIIARWVMVVTSFERALYTNPDQDLNSIWWRLVQEFQLLTKPEGRGDHDNWPDWAAKIHIASSPVYYQNYLLGELFAAQIADTLEKEALKTSFNEKSFYGVPKVGEILKERLFKSGSEWSWNKLVPHVTHKELGTDSFAKQFCF